LQALLLACTPACQQGAVARTPSSRSATPPRHPASAALVLCPDTPPPPPCCCLHVDFITNFDKLTRLGAKFDPDAYLVPEKLLVTRY